jgi:hypothetical protein
LKEARVLRTVFTVLVFLFSSSAAQAKTIEADYSVEFGIVGQVGKVHATLTTDERYYMIDANVSALGIAKVVTDDLKERHISKGYVIKGVLVTHMYQMIKSYGEYTSTTIYKVDHAKKRVTRKDKLWQYGKLVRDRKITLDYYGKDDLLTLFLNLPQHIQQKLTPKDYVFTVVGEDRMDGRVDVNIPSPGSRQKIQSFVDKGKAGDWFATVIMHRQLYQSSQGELDIRVGQEGLVEKAVLKDLFFFGDVRIIKQ